MEDPRDHSNLFRDEKLRGMRGRIVVLGVEPSDYFVRPSVLTVPSLLSIHNRKSITLKKFKIC